MAHVVMVYIVTTYTVRAYIDMANTDILACKAGEYDSWYAEALITSTWQILT